MHGKRNSPLDMEVGFPIMVLEEDNSKSKRRNKWMLWKRYSKAIYLFGIIVCCCSLLYWLYVYLCNYSLSSQLKAFSLNRETTAFKLMIVADLDKESRVKDDKKGRWRSILKKGELRKQKDGSFTIHWLEDQEIFTQLSEAGRGMELSAPLEYHDRLYSFDDRTGLVFELVKGNKAIPRYILMEGDGDTTKGQKTEWATVKDDSMIAGSFGKEYTNPDGSIANTNNMWVSIIHNTGEITHEDWTGRFNKLRKVAGCPYPGYMIHEAIMWSAIRRQWVILPRRVSKEPYDEKEDEKRGSNVVMLASEDFSSIEVRHITPITPTRGFSEFKFLPESNDEIIVALKSEENEEQQTQNSYITVFDLEGHILLSESVIPGNHKFEGLEFYHFCCVC